MLIVGIILIFLYAIDDLNPQKLFVMKYAIKTFQKTRGTVATIVCIFKKAPPLLKGISNEMKVKKNDQLKKA